MYVCCSRGGVGGGEGWGVVRGDLVVSMCERTE